MRRVVAVVAVLLILVGAEVAVRIVATHRLTSAATCALAKQQHGAVHGSVSGFPLTYRLLTGQGIPHVEVQTTASGSAVDVTLDDVRFRHGLAARRADVDVRVPWAAMRRQLPAEITEQYGDDLELGADGDLLAADLSVLGATVRLNYAVSTAGGSIVLEPTKAVVGGLEVPVDVVRTMTGGVFADALATRRIKPELPLSATLETARVTAAGLRLRLTLGADALSRFDHCI